MLVGLVDMQPFPIDYEPTNLTPCLTVRVRREVGTIDSTNTRLVEHWQTDAPVLTNRRRDVGGVEFWNDMNPTPSRLYRESVLQNQPFVVPSAGSAEVKSSKKIQDQIGKTLLEMDKVRQRMRITKDKEEQGELQLTYQQLQQFYQTLAQEQQQADVDSLSQNPYFSKYDVASDSRNVARELRGAVSEDIVDRGMRQNKNLLGRAFMSTRWVSAEHVEEKGLNSLDAYELMRPKRDNWEKNYKS
jgi:hypothetical protein